ncbi:MAG: glucose/mannose-6-phosphate isomerase [Bacteroidia bacterium]|jgi:glucose/mannose-6-phosphate isomerase
MITHETSLKEFDQQLDYSLDNYTNHGLKSSNFQNVVMGGLGGSGIGASMAKSWFFDKSALPIETINDYNLPAYVNAQTLVILNSYSGNTEETISLFEEALDKDASIVCLASGGKIQAMAEANNVVCYPIKLGFQPRQTLGIGLTYLVLILGDFFDSDYSAELQEIKSKLIENQAKQIASAERIFGYFASSLKNKFVILADRAMLPVATRFAQQLNENAKLEAFVHPVPECNHNVLESYTDRLPTNFLLLHTEENLSVGSRFDFIAGHLEMDNNRVLPLAIPNYDLYTIYDVNYRLDWFSVLAGNELDADLMNVPILTSLKEFMNEVEIIQAPEGEEEED